MTFGDLEDVATKRFRYYSKVPFDLFDLCVIHDGLYIPIKSKMQRDSSENILCQT